MMQLVVLLSVVLSVLYSQGTDACPDECSCRKASDCDGTYVYCYDRGLSGVPTNIPTDTCRLYLESNQITVLTDGIFDSLVNLELLYLSGNRITTLQKEAFAGLVKLKTFAIQRNPLACDCQLIAFVRFAESRNLTLKRYSYDPEPSCHSPVNLNGTLLKDERLQDLVCETDSTIRTDARTVTTATDARSTRPDINTTGTNSVTSITKETVPIPTRAIIIIILATLVLVFATATGIFAYQRRRREETNYEPPRPYPDSNPGYAIPLHVYEAASDDRTYDEVEPSEEAEYDDTLGPPYL